MPKRSRNGDCIPKQNAHLSLPPRGEEADYDLAKRVRTKADGDYHDARKKLKQRRAEHEKALDALKEAEEHFSRCERVLNVANENLHAAELAQKRKGRND